MNAPSGDAQPEVVQASQQLVCGLMHAAPREPCLWQDFAPSRIAQLVWPLELVVQQAKKPARPQVECDAHFLMAAWHALGIAPARAARWAARAMHRT